MTHLGNQEAKKRLDDVLRQVANSNRHRIFQALFPDQYVNQPVAFNLPTWQRASAKFECLYCPACLQGHQTVLPHLLEVIQCKCQAH